MTSLPVDMRFYSNKRGHNYSNPQSQHIDLAELQQSGFQHNGLVIELLKSRFSIPFDVFQDFINGNHLPVLDIAADLAL